MRRNPFAGWKLWIGAWLLLWIHSSVLRAFDCNSNGTDDVEDLASGASEDCNGNAVPDECEVPPVLFGLGQRMFTAPHVPKFVETADLDGDGDLDLVVGSQRHNGDRVSVLLNEQDRRFAFAAEYEVSSLYSLALGDFNGDGDPDVVTANGGSIGVLMSQCNGSLSLPESYPRPGPLFQTEFVTVGDVDGDGFLDIVATNHETEHLSVLRNRGTGAFSESVHFRVGDGPEQVVAVDFDGDGHLDLATVNNRSSDFTIIFGDGDGAFSEPTSYPLGGRLPTVLKAADFDGDSAPDLVAVTATAFSVLMYDGDREFSEATVYPVDRIRALAVGDFNSDGVVDLGLAKSRDILVMVNDGEGHFDLLVPFPGMPGAPGCLASGDYDNDGKVDIAMVFAIPNQAQVLWNGDASALSVESDTIQPLVGCQRPENGCRPHSGSVADIDGDGDMDVVGCNTHPGSFSILLNDGQGEMEIQSAYTFGKEHPQSVALADVDGDTDIDAVTCDNLDHDLWVHLNKGDGSFSPPTKTPVGNGPINVKLADLDNDGDVDAVTANEGVNRISVVLNAGDGTFRLEDRSDYRVGAAPKAVEAVDLDGDSYLDLAVANAGSPFVSLLWNRGDGTFEEERTDLQLTSVANHVVGGDLDGDGDMDLATADPNRRTSSVLLNGGDRRFRASVAYSTGVSPYSVILVDFNGDQHLDLVTANEGSSSVSVLLGRGDGTFRAPAIFPAGAGPRFVVSADFDADGDMDLVTTNREGRSFTVFYNQLNNSTKEVEYLETVCTPADFHWISVARTGGSPVGRFVKYTLPVRDDAAPLPGLVFQNTRLYALHWDFLSTNFPERFSGLTPKEYDNLVGVRATREYFVGAVSRLQTSQGNLYGFSVFARFNDPLESLTAEEVKDIYERLRLAFRLEPFAYVPSSRAAIEVARKWKEPGFPVYLDSSAAPTFSYEPYTKGVAYGRVNLLTPEEFETANSNGGLSFQVIPVLRDAPRDIEGVVAAVVTAEPQGELSHLTIRTHRRGTPNAYISDALEEFASVEGKLIRFEVSEASYRVEEATEEEAEAWWAANRPTLSVFPSLDREYKEFASLEEIATLSSTEVPPVEARFGGKASNLARLQPLLVDEWSEYQEKGFAVPVHYYLDFLRSNRLFSALDVSREVSYEAYLEELYADAEFQTNPRFRLDALEYLREHMKNEGRVDAGLVQQLAARIVEVFGSSTSRVRFRSSSNVEDAVEFNGAGLYDSTSVCAEDNLDGEDDGPSHCDPLRDNERGVERGLKKVWASLWNFGAYEERAFYGVPQEIAAMGVLVNRAFPDERANGVALTGSPTNPLDRRYVVTAQKGEESVVTPDPGVLPEKDILEVEDGEVVEIIRAVASSLVPRGSFVLSDDELRELGSLLWHMDQQFPIDLGEHQREDLLIDVEFKIERSGDLAVKQIRPFLVTDPGPPPPTFELVIPADTMACGMFSIGREPQAEYELKSTLRLIEGALLLPAGAGTFPAELVEEIVIGPDRQVATPEGQGVFNVETIRGDPGELIYRFDFAQTFMLPSGERFQLKLSQLTYRSLEGAVVEVSKVLDGELLTDGVFLRVEGDEDLLVLYSSCTHDTLPLWEVRAEFFDGVTVVLEERYRPVLDKDFGPASVTYGRVERAIGQGREADGYWDLVYSAIKHNEHVVYWIALDPPLRPLGSDQMAHFIELVAPIPTDDLGAKANYLGASFEVLAAAMVKSYTKESLQGPPEKGFRRGDCTGDGTHDIADALAYVAFLFFAEEPPACLEACDVNGDSKNDFSDAIGILNYLFRGGPVPEEPFPCCGSDPYPERSLGCEQRVCQ